MRPLGLVISALLAATSFTSQALAAQPKNSVLLSKVQTLTLRSGLKTSHRRVSAIPQLKCVGGNAKGLYDVDVLRCKNAGSDYDDDNIQWTCTASLPEEFKLGSTDVICEGYDSPDDPYILKGSCGVEYRLTLTDKGENKYGKGRGGKRTKPKDGDAGGGADTAFFYIFWILFIGVVLWMLYKAFIAPRDPNRNATVPGGNYGGFGGGGYGGGGDNGTDDPPPPYTSSPSYGTNPKTATRKSPGSSQRNQPWRPGFWSGTAAGTAAGAAAGYAAGNRTRDRTYQDRYQDQYQDHRGPFGGSYGGGGNSRDNGEGSSGSSSSNSSTRYQSTGFGSTSRR